MFGAEVLTVDEVNVVLLDGLASLVLGFANLDDFTRQSLVASTGRRASQLRTNRQSAPFRRRGFGFIHTDGHRSEEEERRASDLTQSYRALGDEKVPDATQLALFRPLNAPSTRRTDRRVSYERTG